MIITRTPFRISFFGGGSDYPVYFKEHGGAVLSTTINKYCYLTCRYLPPFFHHKYRICYSKTELPNDIGEIQHPSVRECLRFSGLKDGVEIIHAGDLPARSGIGSSSAFTVGLLGALHALQGRMVTKRQLALDAIHVEQDLIGENVGSQDQAAAAFGGFNKIEFGGKETLFVRPMILPDDKVAYLQSCLMFCYTGMSRMATHIAKEQIARTPEKTAEIKEMCGMVDDAIRILNGRKEDLNDFGRLLHESWCIKRGLTALVSNDTVDEVYETARRAGALGGKLCGAGGGGFLLLFVPPEQQPAVRNALNHLLFVPFRFENLGSHVVFYAS